MQLARGQWQNSFPRLISFTLQWIVPPRVEQGKSPAALMTVGQHLDLFGPRNTQRVSQALAQLRHLEWRRITGHLPSCWTKFSNEVVARLVKTHGEAYTGINLPQELRMMETGQWTDKRYIRHVASWEPELRASACGATSTR